MKQLETVPLVTGFPAATRLGMGCWAIGGHGWGRVQDDDSVRAVNCALDRGVSFFDTADAYGLGKSESLLSEILGNKRHSLIIGTKGGVKWDDCGNVWTDISPESLRQSLEGSLRRLRLDTIPLYYIHKPDNFTRIGDSIAALRRFQDEGKIVDIGVANFRPEQLLEALKVAPVKVVQLRLNLFEQDLLKEYQKICREYSVQLVAWGALADGLLTGKFGSNSSFGPDDHRSRMADFIGKRYSCNLECVLQLTEFAAERGVPLSQLALRWVLDSSDVTMSLFGAKTDLQVEQNMSASSWRLGSADIHTINSIVENVRRSYGLSS